jgi:hypothetical protein
MFYYRKELEVLTSLELLELDEVTDYLVKINERAIFLLI